MRGLTLLLAALATFSLLAAPSSSRNSSRAKKGAKVSTLSSEFQDRKPDRKITTANWGPRRTKPIRTGPFQVDLVCISFPDCQVPEAKTVKDDLNRVSGYTIKDYYEDYSQGTTYPILQEYPDVYVAPEPFGYYCHWDRWNNKIGWKSGAEGHSRVTKLRGDALDYVRASARGFDKGVMTCYVYCPVLDREKVKKLLREAYPKPKEDWERDTILDYNPQIDWAEPLWPNSLPQALWPSEGRVMVHELGHVLGSPDYYHATEKHDGVEGVPALPWEHSPTGLAYDRLIYHAFVPPETYPVLKEDGVYTLDPRQSRISKVTGGPEPILGYFIPSSHPNYMFCVEYVHDEKLPVGKPGAEGLLIYVINVTFSSPTMGPPDLAYVYRRGDPFLKGTGSGDAYLRPGDSFTLKTDPAARIPPLIPGGIEITDIVEKDGKCSFRLTFTKQKFTPQQLKDALLPKIRLLEVDEILPTSFHATCDVMYRGEPLLTEYGFTWDVKKNPTIQKNRYPLYHRDRYEARVIDLKPGTTYYVRAYVKNENGVTYSKKEVEIKTPTEVKEVPPLIKDNILNNYYVVRWHTTIGPDLYFNSGGPVLAMMSLGVYYGAMPGGTPKGSKPIEIRKVHTNPSESRPGFRMEAFEAYYAAMKGLVERAGLRDKVFGKMAAWQKKCARELKIKDAKSAFVPVKELTDFQAQTERIKSWIDKSQPVLLVRENNYMPDVTHEIYPLDIAFIDGYDEEGRWHVTFPLGVDRGSKTASGYLSDETLYISVTDALLLFYRP